MAHLPAGPAHSDPGGQSVMSRLPVALLATAALLLAAGAPVRRQAEPVATANDNRTPAGTRRGDTLELGLYVTQATWRIHGENDPGFSVPVFGEEGKPPSVPGPLLRVRTGTPIVATVRNTLSDTLIVMGLHPRGDGARDSVLVLPRASETVRFSAGKPGSYLYRAFTSRRLPDFPGVAQRQRQLAVGVSQLVGAFIVDSAGPVPEDRVLVITTHASLRPSATGVTRERHGIATREFNAINGKSWPFTERLTYAVGDSVRWRVLNAAFLPHPMHLHGFYFRVDSRGTPAGDTVLAADQRVMAVTETLLPGATRSIVWSPDRPGGWIFHCHLTFHAVAMPPVDRPDSVAFPSHHHGDPDAHITTGMSGLVLAMNVTGAPARSAAWKPAHRLRLFIQSDSTAADSARRFGYVLARGAEPKPDSVEYPGPVLVLTRGEPTSIELVNRSGEPSAVHWHGIELESYFDGTVGWGRTVGPNGRMTPAIPNGGRFEARMTPRRAGTFMYHTHFDEMRQQFGGLVGALIVLEPGERWDPAHDLVFLISDGVPRRAFINGSLAPAPMELRVGEKYRIRIADIAVNHPLISVRLAGDSGLVSWRPLAKDGFALSAAQVRSQPSLTRISSGETMDFELVPERPGELVLTIPGPVPTAPPLGSVRLRVVP